MRRDQKIIFHRCQRTFGDKRILWGKGITCGLTHGHYAFCVGYQSHTLPVHRASCGKDEQHTPRHAWFQLWGAGKKPLRKKDQRDKRHLGIMIFLRR